MNKLGFGFLRLPKREEEYDLELINNMVDYYIDKGGKYFDTCYTYLDGFSERAIKECVVKRYPWDKFLIADKLPGYKCKAYEDCRRYFDIELERCGVDYFDVYMLHWLNQSNYDIAQKLDEFRFLRELKSSGDAKMIGFSYHDSSKLLEKILSEHPEVDVVQLQINYLDWESDGIESRKCYEVCVKYGKKVYVMEPVKGGTLCSLPDKAQEILHNFHPDWSNASWAIRFVQSLVNVEICLSGMNSMEQLYENMQNIQPLTTEENDILQCVCEIIKTQIAVPCTACRYCVEHCPKGILIPDYFKLFNEFCRYPDEAWKIAPIYSQIGIGYGKASDCITCHNCERHCPQHIKISTFMKEVSNKFE